MAQLTVGSTFAGHQIDELVGQGGMGVVYRATQLALERPVALKLINPELADEPGFRERFRRESTRAASIDHPHVLPVHHAGDEDGVMFVTMRFVEGVDLRTLIRTGGRLEPRRAVRIANEVAGALAAAHARGLIHRDVKPANVLIADPGGADHAYLTDFGLTKSVASTANLTDTGEWVGTLDYVAPEQIRAQGVDARTDVYALGCMLYYSLAAEVPFLADNYAAKVWAHLNKPPPALAPRFADVPPALDEVVARAMAKEPEDRYQSAREFGDAAVAAVAEAPSVTAGNGAGAQSGRPRKPRARVRMAVLLAFLVLAAFAGLLAQRSGGHNVAAADVRALLDRYQANFTNEDLPGIEQLLAPGFQRQYLADPPLDRAHSIANYTGRFRSTKSPRFVITGVRVTTGAHEATATGRYALSHPGQPHLGDIGTAIYHLVEQHGTLKLDRITSYPDVLVYTVASVRRRFPVRIDATARLAGKKPIVVAHQSGTLTRYGPLVAIPLNSSGRTLVRSTQSIVVTVTYRWANGTLRERPFSIRFSPS